MVERDRGDRDDRHRRPRFLLHRGRRLGAGLHVEVRKRRAGRVAAA